VKDKDVRTLLLSQPVPDEHIAEERTWETVRGAFLAREPVPRERRMPKRLLLVLALAGVGVGLALSPAGSAIGGWIRDTVGRERTVGVPTAKPALVSLPAPGRVLVAANTGVWVVEEDGSRRRVGAFTGASWSPQGLFVVAWRGRLLAAVDPAATDDLHWSLSRRRIRAARWSPSGFRVAYLSGRSLRVVVGNGANDKELVARVAPVAPAWRPGSEHVLAYADPRGRIFVVDTDTEKALWRTARAPLPVELEWTDDADRLAVLGERQLRLFEAPRRLVASILLPEEFVGTAVATRPGTRDVAYAVFSPTTGEGSIFLLEGESERPRLMFGGAGRFRDLTWSPDGNLLLFGWAAADQWLYVPAEGPRVTATSDIARQFDPGGTGLTPFPRIEGWCCAPDSS
jgi:hypothetical protein